MSGLATAWRIITDRRSRKAAAIVLEHLDDVVEAFRDVRDLRHRLARKAEAGDLDDAIALVAETKARARGRK